LEKTKWSFAEEVEKDFIKLTSGSG